MVNKVITIKEKIFKYLKNNSKKKFSKVSLISNLQISKENLEAFETALKELINEKVILNSHKKLSVNKDLKFFIGKFIYNPKGYGFCISTDEFSEIKEIFIPPSSISSVMYGDRVIASIIQDKTHSDKSYEGKIISILERNTTSLVGTYIDNNDFGFVIPDNPKYNIDIYIAKDRNLGAKSYDKVVVNIEKYPYLNTDKKPEGYIDKVIGFKDDKNIDYLSILEDFGIETEFSSKVLAQVNKIPETIDLSELSKRKDLTEEIIFTIDGEDAKDLDDAISIKILDNGNFLLGVHIADVSHYVKEGSRIDKEALKRGTSIYFINKVVPMLPAKLSNNLCSLNPDEIKLTLTCEMEINRRGTVVKHNIYESYIKSKARLCYNEVSDYLENKSNDVIEKYPFLEDSLLFAKDLQEILFKKRYKRGSVEFNFDEAKIILDENDTPIYLDKYDRRISNEVIEEFMLVANETVSEHFFNLDVPFVYRVHENPRQEKVEDFYNFIKNYDYIVPDEISPLALQEILRQASGKPEENAINILMLQSMQQAKYLPTATGHFALSCTYYSHFTSPIRRYPDLQIHRIIKEYIHGEITEHRKKQLKNIVDYSSKTSSKRERIAQKAEMEYDNLKKAEYMDLHIGEEFEGMITGILATGMYVTLENTVEGFLSIEKISEVIGDLFMPSKNDYKFIGENTKKEILMGNKIKVKVSNVIIENKQVIFDFVSFK